MDEYLNLILNWFEELGIKDKFDLTKLKRQLSIITFFFKAGGVGILEAITGFGKSLVAIILIYRFNLKYSKEKIIVVVPSTKLYMDWCDHVINFGLKNVEIYVINSYVNGYIKCGTKYKCVLFIIDEIHNVLSKEALLFNQTITCTDYQMLFGMTATLSDKEKDILEEMNIPIIDTVSMSEGRRFNYISDYIIYNFGIKLNQEQREFYDRVNDIHNNNYAKFLYFVDSNKNWELIRACTCANLTKAKVGDDWKTGIKWREWYAETMGWDGTEDHKWHPKAIGKYAQQHNWAMVERKNFLYKHESKAYYAKEIINLLNVPTITFSETIDFTDILTNLIGSKAKSYHTKIETKVVDKIVEERRKNFKSAKLLKQRVAGELTVDQETKEYIVTYKKQTKISGKSLKAITLREFEDGTISVLNTAKSLDEGFNVEGIELAIICSSSSQRRQTIQRNGRALRFKEGKRAIIVNLYLMDTQDEAWLKKRQKGETHIRWITTLEEII